MFKSIFLTHFSFLTFYNKVKHDIVRSTICILWLVAICGFIKRHTPRMGAECVFCIKRDAPIKGLLYKIR